ncbi:neuronal PAS domain-containing protein 2-like [Actinia tenebrosa]|uniref:Neuronal PAS domain-containing protein 2-like n=1 Tax=Actinia tenebrosa TaxID=6105 RepID=A0A6P8IMH5_ACTTE|nr:neuronal PAS domain-containing protein 2-like [Actinia tenebrosa]
MKTSRNKSSRRTNKTVDASEKRQDTGLSPSKRHREKLNNVMDELADLLPLSSDAKSGLDRLSILKLTVSFFQTQNLIQSADRTQQLHGANKKKVNVQGVSLSEMALEAIGGFFIVITEDGNVYYVSENVKNYLGYSQTRLMHQDFFSHVHPEDLQGFKSCFEECPSKKTGFSKESHNLPFTVPDSRQECYCNIRCHAGRLSSHISPFYYKCFRFYGHLKMIKRGAKTGSQYGFFALCSPVSRSENINRPIKEHIEKYTCKMDAAMANLQVDSRGLKVLRFNEQDLMGKSAYFFFHPDDLSSMALVHERLMKDFKASITFRILKGNGKWQWVRGTGYTMLKNGQIEGMVAHNVFVSDEEGAYYKAQNIKEMKEWIEGQEKIKALTKCLSSASSSSCSSPCDSAHGSLSSDAESSFQSLSSNTSGFITSTANGVTTSIQTLTVSKSPGYRNGYVLQLPAGDYHEAPSSVNATKTTPNTIYEQPRLPHFNADVTSKSEAVVTSQVSEGCLAVLDNEMTSIIKELHSSFIDEGGHSDSPCSSFSPIQRQPMMTNNVCQNRSGGTETGVNGTNSASFITNPYPVPNAFAFHLGGVFDAPHNDEVSLQDGEHFSAKHLIANPSYLQPDASKSNGVVEESNEYLKDTPNEDSFQDFEMLPLGEIESILSHESHSSYSTTPDSLHPSSSSSSSLPILEHVFMDPQLNPMSESYEQNLASANLPAITEVFETETALYESHGNPITTSDLVSFTFTISNGIETARRKDLSHKKDHGAYIEDLKDNCNLADHHLHKNHHTFNSSSEPIHLANSRVNFTPEARK